MPHMSPAFVDYHAKSPGMSGSTHEPQSAILYHTYKKKKQKQNNNPNRAEPIRRSCAEAEPGRH